MSLPDWRQVAGKRTKRHAQQQKAWPLEDMLLTLIVEADDMDAARELDHLLRSRREKVRRDRGGGGKKSGQVRADYNDKRVLGIIAKLDPKPKPRNLVRKLTEADIGRNAATTALKRLALKGKLPDVYRDYFSRARSKSIGSVSQSREAECFLG